ncbi:pyrroline-5-carboxylate reductase [Cytobacillus purgationiresistens]|uniref:Pyrroline-5-carboxylate reductase n=1 Tax=Cytobacillus purgationiresistens TaxID=863449 RepID=A0ABU0AS55_9BACI|nr:pyrroline-5-carboxylate reductase [Cytobacillus purgationiresistens]MDQ0273637.1 pyrroline-5-carboxylate reductase [Cytobacillus purgationiresistens]
MDKTIGFIGCGKMAQAIIGGILKSKLVLPDQMIASAKSIETLEKVKANYQIEVTESNIKVAKVADILFLAVKPNIHSEIISEIKGDLKDGTTVITIAAGISLNYLEEAFGYPLKAVRSMPNTPSLTGEGMSAVCANDLLDEKSLQDVIDIFSSFGKVEVIVERLMDSVPAISGSSPAYVYMFIEALADGGVKEGLSREQAYKMAAQAVLGAAKMVLDTGKHPGELKDQVCTPGGATIEAVTELEKQGLRAAVLSAMEQCTKKTKGLSKA